MRQRARLSAIALALVMGPGPAAVTAAAQEHGTGQHAHHSAYADQESSGIAGLSAREREQLEKGEGMGLARPAELNGYPGPRHVLDAADELALTPEQRRETERIFAAMKEEAMRIGRSIVEREEILSRRFAHRHVDEEVVRRLTAEIAALQGELRFVHLRAHLEMAALLSPEQIAAYDALRGYQR